ncbi:hypothetical protein, partial [Pseudomonas syringae]|uniref:hypothetical protein n=1 Tax=Pseudomonas syringae TaxID=317 RepID=UPI001C7FAE8D
VYGLLEQSTKETVVLEGSHVGIRYKSARIFSERDAKGTARAVPFVYRGDLLYKTLRLRNRMTSISNPYDSGCSKA